MQNNKADPSKKSSESCTSQQMYPHVIDTSVPPPPVPPPYQHAHMTPNGTQLPAYQTPQYYQGQQPNCQYTPGQMSSLQYQQVMPQSQSMPLYPPLNMNQTPMNQITPTTTPMWQPPMYRGEVYSNNPNNASRNYTPCDSRYGNVPSCDPNGGYYNYNWQKPSNYTSGGWNSSYQQDSSQAGSYCASSCSQRSHRSDVSKSDYNKTVKSESYKNSSSSMTTSSQGDMKQEKGSRFDRHSVSRHRQHKHGSRDSTPSSRRSSKRYSRSPSYRRSRSRSRNRSRSPNRRRSPHQRRSPNRSVSKNVGQSRESSQSTDSRDKRRDRTPTARETLVERWRMNNCNSVQEMTQKLEELYEMNPEQIIEQERKVWTRSAPGDLFYRRDPGNATLMFATPKLLALCEQFDKELLKRSAEILARLPPYNPPPRKTRYRVCKHKSEPCHSSSDGSSSEDEEDRAMEELERKKKHPQRLHPELWHNDPGEMNDGPLCRCSHKSRRSGIRHNVYAGEQHLQKCDVDSNNADKLYHYRITVSPPVNFLTKTPTIIQYDGHEYIFEGFSMFSHFPLKSLPTCKVIRFNIEYTILYIDEAPCENFTIRELDLFYDYLFKEVLELVDLDLRAFEDKTGCNQFHFMPRFVRDLPENGKEILSMNEVLSYLLESNQPLISENKLPDIQKMTQYEWQVFADEVKCMVVTCPGEKPCSLRVDQLDREQNNLNPKAYPEIVHFGIRPPQLSYAGNPEYQKAWRDYVKFRHLLANMPKPSRDDKRRLAYKESRLQEMRTLSKMKRDVTIALSSEGFYRTGIMCDMIQHALLLPVLVCHLRFHRSLDVLEQEMGYQFKNRYLLQLALTHPSYRENFGTNPDHARNSLTNCGIRQPEYGDRRIHYMNTRKRGINTLIQIMSRFGKKTATESNIGHNERLEFLGDAVVEFITSIHLFHLFPDLEEGGLATYRAAIVQNQHLAVLAKKLHLEAYMLYAHGSDLCHDLELRHAMANCFEALMGALFLDGGIEVADKVFGETLFQDDPDLISIWANYPLHPLQEQEPDTDRQWISQFSALQKLTEFEERIGIKFRHIRLLARAFTDRSVGFTNLTLGSNQRLEFLGDTVLQIIASEYLYKFFPEHHEGHLSLLRSSLVNNRTQAVVCDDLGMTQYAIYANPKADIKTKDRADLLEAFLGALYVDKGLKHCHVFCEVCFFPRLQDFIMNQDWNDPKSKLQQCCLTLRTMEGGEPDIPMYKVIECMGPTNTRVYTVAVYFRGERLAQASGHSIQQAEMNAARQAISLSNELFPQLDHQKRVIAKSMKKQKKAPDLGSSNRSRSQSVASSERSRSNRTSRSPESERKCERDESEEKSFKRERSWERTKEMKKERIWDKDIKEEKTRFRVKDWKPDTDKIRKREADADRDKCSDPDKDKYRAREKDKSRSCGRDNSKDKDKHKHKGSDVDKDKERNRERNVDMDKDRHKEKSKHTDSRKERDKGKTAPKKKDMVVDDRRSNKCSDKKF